MMRKTFDATSRCLLAAVLIAIAVASAAVVPRTVSAASINYGNFNFPNGVMYLQVTESSGTDPVPLYGPPTPPFVDDLDFSPTAAFSASSANGGADLTDGQLNFTIMTNKPITNIGLFERGDFSLAGAGTAVTEVEAGVVMLATVREINGIPVAPISLPAVNASVGFNLAANPGLVQPWSLGLGLNVAAQVPGATKVDIAINNALFAASQPNTVALIAKKDFRITVDTIPEPTAALLVLAGVGLGAVVLRRRSG